MTLRVSMLVIMGGLVPGAIACTAGGEQVPAGGDGGTAGSAGQPGTGGSPPLGTGGGAGSNSSGGAIASGGSAGSAGSPGAGGGAGTGGSSGSSGSAGTGPTDPMFNNGAAYRFEMPCLYEGDGSPLAECSNGEVCWVAQNDTPANPHSENEVIPMGGDPAVVYRIRMRIRGVIEPKTYSNCELLFSRSQTPPGETRQIAVCKASQDTAWQDTYNVWRLTIGDPAQVFYLNADTEAPTHRVNTIDGEFEFDVRGGSYVEMYFDDLNGGQIRNCSLVVPELAPAPERFDGNFFQLDVVNWSAVP